MSPSVRWNRADRRAMSSITRSRLVSRRTTSSPSPARFASASPFRSRRMSENTSRDRFASWTRAASTPSTAVYARWPSSLNW